MLVRIILCMLVSLLAFHPLSDENLGSFIGEVKVEWIKDPNGPDRRMRLLEDFSYKDPSEKIWGAPIGAEIDGASIPRALWTIVGDPYTGDYRNASVIHDYYCEVKTEASEKVHEMFYWAMRAGGVAKIKAKVMYAAVRMFGPHWKTVKVVETRSSGSPRARESEGKDKVVRTFEMQAEWQEPADENIMKSMKKWIEENDPSLEEIKARDDAAKSKKNEPPSRILSPIKP